MKPIAFYLPAYHQIPENDQFWGEGFTEWDNVRRIPDHKVPMLGYYDLSDPKYRKEHTDIAQSYGIYGFCYYHFWLQGRPIFTKPFDNILASKDNHPFCFCWANENWTKRWDGMKKEVLISQEYDDPVEKHFEYLQKFFDDNRYIKIDGKPVLLIYLPKLVPSKRLDYYRQRCYIIGCMTLHHGHLNYNNFPIDAVYEFAPFCTDLAPSIDNTKEHILDYDVICKRMINCPKIHYMQFPGVVASWDNTPRCKNIRKPIIMHANPESFEKVLKAKKTGSFMFMNAWNEWGEGACLEPNTIERFVYLEKIKRVVDMCKKLF